MQTMTMNKFAAKYGIRTASLIIETAANTIKAANPLADSQPVVESLTELANDLESAMRQYALDNREAILGLITEEAESNV